MDHLLINLLVKSMKMANAVDFMSGRTQGNKLNF